jgi:hypothetical protein
MATDHVLQPGNDFADEFEFGLGVILDALARWIPEGGAPGGEGAQTPSA